jgi:hypothetical protein
MSELEKTKKEMITILEQIPASGSFEGAELVLKVSELSKKWRELASATPPKVSHSGSISVGKN